MADNVAITAGAGTTVATDDISGVHYQLVKLVWGALDTANVVDDATGKRIPVVVGVALPAGTNNIGDVDVLTVPYATKDHDAANASGNNPVMAGLEAIAHGTNPTAVAAADVTKWYANRAGVPFVIGGHPNVKTIRLNFTSAQTNVAIISVSTGTKIVVTRVQCTVDNGSTVFPQVIIGFATATTPTTTGVVASHPAVPAGGGFNTGDGSGIIGIGADDEDLRITTTGTVGGNGCDVVVSYYTIET